MKEDSAAVRNDSSLNARRLLKRPEEFSPGALFFIWQHRAIASSSLDEKSLAEGFLPNCTVLPQ